MTADAEKVATAGPLVNEWVEDANGNMSYTDTKGTIWVIDSDSPEVLFGTTEDGKTFTFTHDDGFVASGHAFMVKDNVWTSPDGTTTITEVNGNLFRSGPDGYAMKYGPELARLLPRSGDGWHAVSKLGFDSALQGSREIEGLKATDAGRAQLQLLDDTMHLLQRGGEAYVRGAGFVAGLFSGPVGQAVAAAANLAQLDDALSRADTFEEKMWILVDAADRGGPSIGIRSPGGHPTKTPDADAPPPTKTPDADAPPPSKTDADALPSKTPDADAPPPTKAPDANAPPPAKTDADAPPPTKAKDADAPPTKTGDGDVPPATKLDGPPKGAEPIVQKVYAEQGHYPVRDPLAQDLANPDARHRHVIDQQNRPLLAEGWARPQAADRHADQRTLSTSMLGKEGGTQASHGLAARFGGDGRWFNLTPLPATTNQSSVSALENKIAASLRAGDQVFIQNFTNYAGSGRVPSSAQFRAFVVKNGVTKPLFDETFYTSH